MAKVNEMKWERKMKVNCQELRGERGDLGPLECWKPMGLSS